MIGRSIGAFLSAIVVLVLLIAFAAMWLFGWGWFSRETADFRGRTQQINQIQGNGQYRTQAYEHFFDLDAEITRKEHTICALIDERKTATAQRKGEIDSFKTGLVSALAGDIATYNNDAREDVTKGQFRSWKLPATEPEFQEDTCS